LRYAATVTLPSLFLRPALNDMISDGEVKDLGRQFGQLWCYRVDGASARSERVGLGKQVVASGPHATSVQMTAVCES